MHIMNTFMLTQTDKSLVPPTWAKESQDPEVPGPCFPKSWLNLEKKSESVMNETWPSSMPAHARSGPGLCTLSYSANQTKGVCKEASVVSKLFCRFYNSALRGLLRCGGGDMLKVWGSLSAHLPSQATPLLDVSSSVPSSVLPCVGCCKDT